VSNSLETKSFSTSKIFRTSLKKILKHQSKRQHLPRKNPSLKKILRSLRLKMMKRRKLMEESNPRLHHMMKLLRMCHLLQWGGL
jgi:hypothetical protein